MITDAQAEAANNYIRDNADKYAEVKKNRIYFEQYRKCQKAILMQEVEGAGHIKEAYAYSHADYILNLKAWAEAVFIEEKIRKALVQSKAGNQRRRCC